MEWFEISGGYPLHGEIAVQGAKNAALPMIAAAVLAEGTTVLENVPDLLDIRSMDELLMSLGGRIQRVDATNELLIHTQDMTGTTIDDQYMRRMRSSIFLVGPLLARFGQAEAAMPGGCAIGERSIDLHIEGLQALGVKCNYADGRYRFQVSGARLQGSHIRLRYPSVGATENLMMAAVLAEGETIIEQSACEPEVVNLQEMLLRMGAKIHGAGSGTIFIQGVQKLQPNRIRVIPDRIVAGTWMIATAITRGMVELKAVDLAHLKPLIHLLRAIGVEIRTAASGNLVVSNRKRLRSFERVVTAPFPLFATDLQAQLMVLLALSDGNSIIRETVFEQRFQHVPSLRQMGAQIRIVGPDAIIQGVEALRPADMKATDLRAGAALVLAALSAHGTSRIGQIEYIDRGYERMEQLIGKLGARCLRMNDHKDNRYASAG